MFIYDSKVSLCNYADDNTSHTAEKDPSDRMRRLHVSFQHGIRETVSSWMKINIVLNGRRKYDVEFILHINKFVLKKVTHVKMLDNETDNQLSYTKHIWKLCKKVGVKVNSCFIQNRKGKKGRGRGVVSQNEEV